MDKFEKYEQLARLFFRRLVLLEGDINRLQDKLAKGNIKIYLETNDIFPLLDFAKIIGVNDSAIGSKLYNDVNKLINDGNTEYLDKSVKKFLEKYIE